MTNLAPVTPVNAAQTTNPGAETAQQQLQQAFAQGLVQFMGVMLQNAESDVAAAINDNTSTPDAVD